MKDGKVSYTLSEGLLQFNKLYSALEQCFNEYGHIFPVSEVGDVVWEIG